jgi:hypothetical protein
MGDPGDAHGKGMRGVEDDVCLVPPEEVGKSVVGEAANLDLHLGQLAKQVGARLGPGHRCPDLKAGVCQGTSQDGAFTRSAQEQQLVSHLSVQWSFAKRVPTAHYIMNV